MDFATCTVNWDAPAALKDMEVPRRGFAWVGEPLPAVTVAGAIRTFRELPGEVQRRAEMGVNAGAIEGCKEDFLGFDVLTVLASRKDVPEG